MDAIAPQNPLNPKWTDDQVETLKTLWAMDKHSCGVIGAMLGGFSRNAVIGKVHRLGLPRRKQPNLARADIVTLKGIRKRKPITPSLRPLKPLPARIPEPVSGGKTILEVTGCRFATGQNEKHIHVFCDAAQDEGSSYCQYHREIVKRKLEVGK